MRAFASAILISTLVSSAASDLCVSATDDSLQLCVSENGALASVSPRGAASLTLTSGGSSLAGCAAVNSSAVQNPSGDVVITSHWVCNATNATVVDMLTPTPRTIHWSAAISGGAAHWSTPLIQGFALDAISTARSKLWAAWDRDAQSTFPSTFVDPLQPSDLLPSGWWTGSYRYGNNRRFSGTDVITLPVVTVLGANAARASDSDWGFSLVPSPRGAAPLELWLETTGGGATGGPAALEWQRRHHRMGGAASPLRLDADFIGHDGDWRAALAWLATEYADYLAPVNTDVFSTCNGTGSYSWFINASALAADADTLRGMAYAVNWDLSGRFFPYMGMFLPPVNPGDVWLNDPEGSQPRANVTFDIIGAWYRAMLAQGFTDLSYFNINEYGINIVLPPASDISAARARGALSPRTPTAAATAAGGTCAASWQNASTCLAEALLDSLLTHSWDEHSSDVVHGALYSWQNAVVMDPAEGSSYRAFMLEQLERHILYEDGFAGIIIDRSDWADFYNLDGDDGVSFVEGAAALPGETGVASALRVSYLQTIAELRAAMVSAAARARASTGATPYGAGLMLMNTLGNARMDSLRHYDGTFSEGNGVSGVGLLGLMSPAILWTYDTAECCSSAARADLFFQAQLYLGVQPMLPFPGNDHSLPWDPASIPYYLHYGPLLAALSTRVWALNSHIAAAVNASGIAAAKVNAFIALVDGGGDQALLLPVVLGAVPNGTARINCTAVDRAWQSMHPALQARQRAAPSPAPAGAAAVNYVIDALLPGAGVWTPLPTQLSPSFLLDVPLANGAALVRIRSVAAD